MSDPVSQAVDWRAAPPWAVCRTTDRRGTWYWSCEPVWNDLWHDYRLGPEIGLHVMCINDTPGPRRVERRPQEEERVTG